jgi:acyl carrier protein
MLTKEEVLYVIKANLQLVLGDDFDEQTYNPALSILDHGANSLELVEIVSRTMRELKVRVPRTKLSTLENIDQLADAIVAVASHNAG